MSKITKSYTDSEYGQLHCRGVYPADADNSSSPPWPIVCLHMSPKSGQIFHDVLPHIAKDRAAIAPDYPGHGESALPPAQPHVTVSDFARAIWRVIDDRLSTKKAHLVGYHTGSMVAVEAALIHPEKVASITCIGAPVFNATELDILKQAFEPIAIDTEGTRFKIMWQRIMHHRGPGMTLQMAADSMAENLRSGDNYEWGHRAAFAYAERFVEAIPTLSCPIFVMNTIDDVYESTQRIQPILPNCHYQEYKNWGHGFLRAYSADAAAELLNFISKVEQ